MLTNYVCFCTSKNIVPLVHFVTGEQIEIGFQKV